MRENLDNLEHGDDFRYNTKTRTYEIIDKLDFSKIKDSCSVKYDVKRKRIQAINWKKYLHKGTHLSQF